MRFFLSFLGTLAVTTALSTNVEVALFRGDRPNDYNLNIVLTGSPAVRIVRLDELKVEGWGGGENATFRLDTFTMRVTHPDSFQVSGKLTGDFKDTFTLHVVDPAHPIDPAALSGAGGLRASWLLLATLLSGGFLATRAAGGGGGGAERRSALALACCLVVVLSLLGSPTAAVDAKEVVIALPPGVSFNAASIKGASVINCDLQMEGFANELRLDGYEVQNGEECMPNFPQRGRLVASLQCVDSEDMLGSGKVYHFERTLGDMERWAKENNYKWFAVTGESDVQIIRHGFATNEDTLPWSAAECLPFGDFSRKNEENSASWVVYSTFQHAERVSDCDTSGWKDMKLSCEPKATSCKLLINNSGAYGNRCDKYCESLGRKCSGSWDDGDFNTCQAQKTGSCSTVWPDTSDIICECTSKVSTTPPPTTSGDCDVSTWPDKISACGPCKLLLDNAATKYGSNCNTYCKAIGRTCVASADDVTSNSCRAEATGPCSTNWGSTSDIICTCSGQGVVVPSTRAPTAAPPTEAPPAPGGKIEFIGSTKMWAATGIIEITPHANSKPGDLLVLILFRTDDDLPVAVAGWNPVAQCMKRWNEDECGITKNCDRWHKEPYFCASFGALGHGHDLALSVHTKQFRSGDNKKFTFQLNVLDNTGHPGWAILATIRNADTSSNPLRHWTYKGCDRVVQSKFPSVDAKNGDMILLAQGFDDYVSADKFTKPSGFSDFGYVGQSDETGFLFGRVWDKDGATGTMITGGAGGNGCKDIVVSMAVKPAA